LFVSFFLPGHPIALFIFSGHFVFNELMYYFAPFSRPLYLLKNGNS